MTFEQLDLLLRQVSEGMDGTADWPPPQEKECMAVATLNLLRLQVLTLQFLPLYKCLWDSSWIYGHVKFEKDVSLFQLKLRFSFLS